MAWRLRRCLLAVDREQVQLAEIWTCLVAMDPQLAHRSDRAAVLRDAFAELAASGWIALPTGPNAYTRRRIPLPRSVRVLRPEHRARRLGTTRAVAWRPELAWAADLDVSPRDVDDLHRIDAWLRSEAEHAVLVPPRERSLQLFGAGREDRLHEIAATDLFAPGRLSWELLACVPVPRPFVWSAVGPGGLLLVVSGHETFASVRRALVEAPVASVGVVAYGAGRHFAESVSFARSLDRPVERIWYYGNVDAEGLRIPIRATERAAREHLPPVEPAAALYELLLCHGQPSPVRPVPVDEAETLARWLPESLRAAVVQLLVGGRRLIQEWVGYEVLIAEEVWSALA